MKFQTPNVELSIRACRSTKTGSMSARALLWFAVTSLFLLQQHPVAAALSTSGRWIVDESGKRVKLACINWVSHLEVMVPEGLNKQPLDAISKSIASMGFNCVRLTWPVYLLTNNSLKTLTVRQSFFSLGLVETIAAIKANNPAIIDLHLLHAFKAAIKKLSNVSLQWSIYQPHLLLLLQKLLQCISTFVTIPCALFLGRLASPHARTARCVSRLRL